MLVEPNQVCDERKHAFDERHANKSKRRDTENVSWNFLPLILFKLFRAKLIAFACSTHEWMTDSRVWVNKAIFLKIRQETVIFLLKGSWNTISNNKGKNNSLCKNAIKRRILDEAQQDEWTSVRDILQNKDSSWILFKSPAKEGNVKLTGY